MFRSLSRTIKEDIYPFIVQFTKFKKKEILLTDSKFPYVRGAIKTVYPGRIDIDREINVASYPAATFVTPHQISGRFA